MNRCVSRVIYGFSVLFISCFLGFAAFAQPPAPSKEGKVPDAHKTRPNPLLTGSEKGAFNIYVEEQLKGTEEFDVEPVGNQFVARGKIQLTITRDEKPVQYVIDTELVLKPNFDPIRYNMTQKFEGNASSIKMTFQEGKATAEFTTGSGIERRDYQLAPDVALLDDNIFHQYALLAQRYDYEKGGLQEFSAFIPQESIGGVLHIIYKGDEKIDVGGKSVAVQHLLVDTNDLKLDLYVEGLRHHLVKMEVPSSKVAVVLQK